MPKLSALSGVLLISVIAGTALGLPQAQPDASKPAPAKGDEKPAAPAADKAAPADKSPPTGGGDDAARKVTDEDLLSDFVHYVLIEQIPLAASTGQTLLDRNIEPVKFVKLVDSTVGNARFQNAFVRAQRHGDLEPVAARLYTLYESGKRATVRSPGSVAENIKLLTGDARARSIGRDRLKAAKEYAMPQLLQALLQKQDGRLQVEARQVMVEMGRDAVMPLCAALIELDPASQQVVADILGDIGYPSALPFLYQLREKTRVEDVRRTSEDAIRRIAQVVNDSVPVADRFVDLAEQYYNEVPSLTVFQSEGQPESHQLLWTYNPGAGLLMTAIETPVYHEAVAMRLCETALREDGRNARAVPLWLASNFSREIDTPKVEGYTNPAYDRNRDATYYAVMAGGGPTQQVVARGLDSSDTPLIRKALAALEQTAGGSSLWAGQGERKPLLEALRYPSRRVQYEAALALGGASPRESFDGSDQVVRILASAIRDASARYALVVTNNTEAATQYGDLLRNQGYTVLPPTASLEGAQQAVAESPGIDLVVTRLPSAQTSAIIDQAANSPKLRASPILALVSPQGYAEQAARYLRNERVRFLRDSANSAEVGESAKQLVEKATGGGITQEEAESYKARSLAVLRDLAVSSNAVLNVADATGPLVTALADAKGQTRMRICEVLAHVNNPQAQRAVIDAALASKGDEQVNLFTHAAGSAKRFGNLLEPRQVTAIKEVATTGGPAEATAAAALMGSLNLPSAEIVPLIIGADSREGAANRASR